MIEVNDLTLKYKSGKGIFNLNFQVKGGEIMGYLGPNGAGKTTTIRVLLGFMQPDGGKCTINGLDTFKDAPNIQKSLGYIPGEIAFLDGVNGNEFLNFICKMRGTKDTTRQKQLIEMFELDLSGHIKKYSKGMKQKVGIIAAFMHNPDVIILDEPTSGLDPLMQARFVELILEEKKKGKTVLMSSHMFEEIEKTCDNVLIIKDGSIIKQSDVKTLKAAQRKAYIVRSTQIEKIIKQLKSSGFEVGEVTNQTAEIFVAGDSVDRFIKQAAAFTISDFDVKAQTLEDIFMNFYSKGGKTK